MTVNALRSVLAAIALAVGVMLMLARTAAADGNAIATAGSAPPPRVAVTVDDIPDHGDLVSGFTRADISRDIIKALKDNGVVSVVAFTNGTFMEDDPQEIGILKDWLAAGYILGNHTYDHPDLTKVSERAFVKSIVKQDRLLSTLATFSPLTRDRHVFRYPYLDEGNTFAKRDAVRSYLFKHGYRIGQVTTDYFDWAWTDAFTRCTAQHRSNEVDWLRKNVVISADRHLRESQDLARALLKRDIPQILLIHVGVFDAIMLDTILKQWRTEGVRFISLDEALSDPVYAINPNVVYSDGRDFLAQIAMARKVDIEPLIDSTYSIDNLNRVCADRGLQP